jgi:DNA mismatch endonuclease, patch repair protein
VDRHIRSPDRLYVLRLLLLSHYMFRWRGTGTRYLHREMADTVSRETRSRMMAAVKGRDTAPERRVRSVLFADGFRFRLHRKDLPGKPDIVLPRYRIVIFVHGCFWHGHDCQKGRHRPTTRPTFWDTKLNRNVERDRTNHAALGAEGWTVFVLWTCQLEDDLARLRDDLRQRRAKVRLSCAAGVNRQSQITSKEAG